MYQVSIYVGKRIRLMGLHIYKTDGLEGEQNQRSIWSHKILRNQSSVTLICDRRFSPLAQRRPRPHRLSLPIAPWHYLLFIRRSSL
jgi:hypothetical protein